MSPWLRVALFVPLALATTGVAHAADPVQAAGAPQASDPPKAAAPAKVPDPSVKTRLDARDIKFEVDEDGDYKLVFSFEEDERTQIVFVSGGTEDFGGLKVREVFAPAARLKEGGVTGDLARELLRNSRTRKIGAWETDDDLLYYVIKLPDSADAELLETAMDLAAQMADDMEKQISGDRDEL
ncbi:MAG: hypothetical protein ACTHOC_09645 [Luteimonas sp.]